MSLKAMLSLALAGVLFAIPSAAQEEDVLPPPRPPPPPGPYMRGALPPPAFSIPPRLVERLGLPKELVQKIQDLTFEANGQLITLEADLRRAQLELDKLLHSQNPSDSAVMQQVEAVGRSETAVRKNRIGMMLQLKRLLGPDNWQKFEAEMGEMRPGVWGSRHPRPPPPTRGVW